MKGVTLLALISILATGHVSVSDTAYADIKNVPDPEREIKVQLRVAENNLTQLQALPDTIRKYAKE